MVVAGQLGQIVVGSTVVEWLWFGSSRNQKRYFRDGNQYVIPVGFELECIGMVAFELELEWWQHLVGSKI